MKATGAAVALARKPEVAKSELLIRTISLTVQAMTPESFAPYGEIVGERGDIKLDFDPAISGGRDVCA